MTDLARRGFLVGLAATALCAPAIVRAGNIMPVRMPIVMRPPLVASIIKEWVVTSVRWGDGPGLYADVEMVEVVTCTDFPPAVSIAGRTPGAARRVLDRDAVHSYVANQDSITHSWPTLRGPAYIEDILPRRAKAIVTKAAAIKLQPGDTVDVSGMWGLG